MLNLADFDFEIDSDFDLENDFDFDVVLNSKS